MGMKAIRLHCLCEEAIRLHCLCEEAFAFIASVKCQTVGGLTVHCVCIHKVGIVQLSFKTTVERLTVNSVHLPSYSRLACFIVPTADDIDWSGSRRVDCVYRVDAFTPMLSYFGQHSLTIIQNQLMIRNGKAIGGLILPTTRFCF